MIAVGNKAYNEPVIDQLSRVLEFENHIIASDEQSRTRHLMDKASFYRP